MPGPIAILLKSFMMFPGHAQRTGNGELLPFHTRAGHAFLALALVGLPFLLIALAVVVIRSRGRSVSDVVRLLLGWSAVIVTGALIAATDARNERGWNPALYGSAFAAAAFPVALAAGLPRDDERRTGAILCAVIAAFPITLLIAAVGPILIEWGLGHRWPVGW